MNNKEKKEYIKKFGRYWSLFGLICGMFIEAYNLVNNHLIGIGLIICSLSYIMSYLIELCVWRRK
jgi:hypothetical protein